MKALLIIVALIGLATCSNSETLPTPVGPVFALNPGHWQPTPADLQLPRFGTAE